jgi:hypothetical protein
LGNDNKDVEIAEEAAKTQIKGRFIAKLSWATQNQVKAPVEDRRHYIYTGRSW